MEDHCLLIGHRSVARVLLAYFMGLGRSEVTDLDVPLGVVYCLEPRPYGVDMRVFRWKGADEGWDGGNGHGNGEGDGERKEPSADDFEEMMDYELKRSKEGHE